jgi:UDP-glucose 4-epimerase
MIDNNEQGLYFPQNTEYVKTAEMVRLISEIYEKNVRLTKVFNPLLRFMGNFVGTVNKAFGNLVYEHRMSDYKENYRIRGLKESIVVTEAEKS